MSCYNKSPKLPKKRISKLTVRKFHIRQKGRIGINSLHDVKFSVHQST